MPRKIFKKIEVKHHILEKIPFFNKIPNRFKNTLFSITRRSVSLAFLFGLFFAFIPMPFQMLAVLITAILFKHNLPISVVLVWITNPVTMPFIFGMEYFLGSWLLNYEIIEFSFDTFMNSGFEVIISLYFGSFIGASGFSLLGYSLIHLYWRFIIFKKRKLFK